MLGEEIDTDECPLCLENFQPVKNRKSYVIRMCQRVRELGVRELRSPTNI